MWRSPTVEAKKDALESGEVLPPSPPPKRSGKAWCVITMDCMQWLEEQEDASLPSIVVSIPDLAELRHLPPGLRITDAAEYETWFRRIAAACFAKARPDAYVIFFQTDRYLSRGSPPRRISKFGLAFIESVVAGTHLLWHKIVTKGLDIVPTGNGRPQFSHLFCFSKVAACATGVTDVISEGHKGWSNATPDNVVAIVLDMLPPDHGLVDLFSGEGTVAIAAAMAGFSNITCVEIDAARCKAVATQLAEIEARMSIV